MKADAGRVEWVARFTVAWVADGCNPRTEVSLLAFAQRKLNAFDVYGDDAKEGAKAALALCVIKEWLTVYIPNRDSSNFAWEKRYPKPTRYHCGPVALDCVQELADGDQQ